VTLPNLHSAVTGAVAMFCLPARAGRVPKPKPRPKPSGWSRALRSPTRAGDVGNLATWQRAPGDATADLRAIETKLFRENASTRESVPFEQVWGWRSGWQAGSAGAFHCLSRCNRRCQPPLAAGTPPLIPRAPPTRHGCKQQYSCTVCVQEETAQRACVKALSCRHVCGRCILC
jgi:hypothetical protein